MGRTLRSKGNGGSHEHRSGILAHCNGGRSCSVGRGASLRSNFYPYAAQEPRQKSLVIAKERPVTLSVKRGRYHFRFLPSKAGLARARRPNRAPRPSAGAELTPGWRHGSSTRVDRRDDRDVGEEREVPRLGHPKRLNWPRRRASPMALIAGPALDHGAALARLLRDRCDAALAA
jgi:hypothetical protein